MEIISSAHLESIPIVDLSPVFSRDQQAELKLAMEVGEICHDIGFFYITNHGIPSSHCSRYMEMLKAFFALPEAVKQSIDKSNSPHYRGWEKLGSELTNNQTDYREQVDIGVDRNPVENPEPYYMRLIGPNQWPDESCLPGFRRVIEDFIQQLCHLSDRLLALMSLSLGLPRDCLGAVFGDRPAPYTKLIRYPGGRSGLQGVGAHKDSGFLTLLLQDEVDGLEAQSIQGQWIKVPPLENSFVVNIGELLQVMTRNYFVATPHRVINVSDCERYSSAFFYSPDLNSRLDPLPIGEEMLQRVENSPFHRDAGLMASRQEMARGVEEMSSRVIPNVFGYKYWQRWARSYPEITEKYHADVVDH